MPGIGFARRLFRSSSISSSRRAAVSIVLIALVMALPLTRLAASAQGDDPNAASPAGAYAEVIAQGVGSIPADEAAWRLVQDTAEPVGDAAFEERALGFAVATDDALLLTDESDGARTRLAHGEAAFVDEGVTQRREGLGDGSSPYWRIALVPSADAEDAGGDTLVYAGDPFTAPAGDRDVDLVAAQLGTNQSTMVKSDYPVLVAVAAGQATAAPVAGGEPVELGKGEAATIAGSVALKATKGGTRILVAVVGAAVPSAQGPIDDGGETGTGKIIVTSKLCPAGVTAEQAADSSAGDPCFDGGPAVGLTVTARNLDTGEVASAAVDATGGTAALAGLPAGSYEVAFDGGDQYGETVGICGGQDRSADLPVVPFGGSAVDLDLPAEREYDCITHTLTPGGDAGDGEAATGSLTATFLACPAEMTFATFDAARCEQVVDGFDFGFQGDGDLHLADATPDSGAFVWGGLPLTDDPANEVAWSPAVFAYPAGYDWFAIAADGGPAMEPHAGGFVLTTGQPYHELAVYFLSK
jgi:hypothetical protein